MAHLCSLFLQELYLQVDSLLVGDSKLYVLHQEILIRC